MSQLPTHQTVLAFDVEGFGDPHRDDSAQTAVRAAVYRMVQESFAAAGVSWEACTHEDRGDGAIVIVPPTVSKVLLLDPLPGCLAAALTEYNRQARLAQRIRLRLALHAGEVARDEHGLSGADLVLACRLLDAAELKAALAQATGPLAVIVSDPVYDGIVRHRYRQIDPASYHPVSVRVKKNRMHAWIHLPGTAAAPAIAAAPPPAGAADPPPPQLPPAAVTFVNRDRELRALELAAGSTGLVVLVGPPGVGKTTLALKWAHLARKRFDGGQLYADLGGFGPGGPAAPEEVLGRFLRALGVAPQQVPLDVVEQTALYRSLTADSRVLVVVDNAVSAAHVRPLLPTSAASTVLVTSRVQLGGLITAGARFVELDPLGERAGVELLARSVGPARIEAEPALAAQLVALCAGLPIALCVTGARLVSRPQWTVQKVVGDLLDERRRLARLSFGDDLSVQAVFDVSYQALSQPAARLYRLLGLHPGPEFGVEVAAAALRVPRLETEGLVDELLGASLMQELPGDRYRFHDLIRLHASGQAQEQETPETRATALRRMLDWYLHTATEAGRVVTPHRGALRRDIEQVPLEPMVFSGHTEALNWLDGERANLLAAARYAADHGPHSVSWQLADAMWGLFLYRTYYRDSMEFDRLAVRVTESGVDRPAAAEAQDRLGLLLHALGRNDEALEHMTVAAQIWRELDQPHRIASSSERFGFVYLDQGRVDLAIDHFSTALAEYRVLGEQRSSGLALISLGRALIEAGRADEAVGHLREASELVDSLPVPDPYNGARALIALGRAENETGAVASAGARLESALAVMRSVNSPLGQADALKALGEVHERTGDRAMARSCYERTVAILEELGNPGAARMRERLSTLGPA